jgi:hypothetical protein
MSFLKNFMSLGSANPSGSAGNPKSQSELLCAMQNLASTQNDAPTKKTSNSRVVDLFFLAGSARNMDSESILDLIHLSWQQNPKLTLKVIFWAGDVRQGAGERRFFRLALKWLEQSYPKTLIKNIQSGNIEFFNRWDSLFELTQDDQVTKAILQHIQEGLEAKDGLLAKWLPRKKQYNNFKKILQEYLQIEDEQYRKLIVGLSKTVEQQISKNDWASVEYPKVPSQAFNKYRQAFLRHDPQRFDQFIDAVNQGKAKIKAEVVYPHQLYQAYNQGKDQKSIIAQWRSLPDYLKDSKERILPVCDVSGSMLGLPLDVSVALGIYISERNQGLFKDSFITFSKNPEVQTLKGDLVEKISQLENADWGMNTDLYQVFKVVLREATKNQIHQSQMPTMILILSDMEFDQAVESETNLESIKSKYKQANYKLPKIVFWNLNGRQHNLPTTKSSQNVGLVSGFSPKILESILSGKIEKFTPENVMLETIESQRYSQVELA